MLRTLALLTATLVLLGAYDQVSGPSGLLTFPEAVWELSLGIYLIVKGSRPDARVLDQTRGSSRSEDRAIPAVAVV